VAVNRIWGWHFGEGLQRASSDFGDEVGYKAVESPHYISDLQATILRQVGLDYKKMDFIVNGRAFHLVEEGQGPIQAILS
jgi:hypothetical protein